jgi:nucleoside-triphosphatase THEP1
MEVTWNNQIVNTKINVLTGTFGIGKSRLAEQVTRKWKEMGYTVSGLLSPARFSQGKKTGIFVQNAENEEIHLLASAIPGEIHGLDFGMWTFDDEVLAWGLNKLKQIKSTDLFVIDELGPLEFEQKKGWSDAFTILQNQAYLMALVVIRPKCISSFKDQGFSFNTIVLDKDLNDEGLLDQLSPQQFNPQK